jgi:hypothetical protein
MFINTFVFQETGLLSRYLLPLLDQKMAVIEIQYLQILGADQLV